MEEWIPIKKQPPKSGKWCIFTDGKNISVERYKEDAIDHFFPPGRWFNLEDAVAWMPSPEPYTEENDGRYTSPGSPCYCKCRQGVGMVEKYPWQLDYTVSIREAIKEIARWTGYLDTDMVTRIQTGLRKLPPTQPERKKGKWIKMSDSDGYYYVCDQCGEDLPRYRAESPTLDNPYPPKYSIDRTNFCPNCGAEMEVADE